VYRPVQVARFPPQERFWVLTAACGETGRAVALMSPHRNAGVVDVFLAQIARELPPRRARALDLGRGGVAPGQGVGDPAQRHGPVPAAVRRELNPIENLWHYLRSHFWSNRLYADYDALIDAATSAWRAACLTASLVQ
jgi:hypothetical protein